MTYAAHERNGYFYKDIRVEVTRRLRYMPYAQAGWIQEGDGDYFTMVSYSSRIFTAHITAYSVEAISTRNANAAINYSRTTNRQVTMAMREIGLTDPTIARLKKWFTSDRGHVTAVNLGRGEWVDGCTGEVIC